MGRNYYEVLGVPKGTSDEAAIKKAYKKAALKFHPDRPGGDKVKFQEVSEAFEVLSDPRKKQLYDRFGEAGLGAAGGSTADDDGGGGGSRQPQGNPFAGRGGQTFSFSTTTGGGGGHGNFHGSDPFSVFESIFGTMDVDQAMGTAGEGECGCGCGCAVCGCVCVNTRTNATVLVATKDKRLDASNFLPFSVRVLLILLIHDSLYEYFILVLVDHIYQVCYILRVVRIPGIPVRCDLEAALYQRVRYLVRIMTPGK